MKNSELDRRSHNLRFQQTRSDRSQLVSFDWPSDLPGAVWVRDTNLTNQICMNKFFESKNHDAQRHSLDKYMPARTESIFDASVSLEK
jgi:hypothetical protein